MDILKYKIHWRMRFQLFAYENLKNKAKINVNVKSVHCHLRELSAYENVKRVCIGVKKGSFRVSKGSSFQSLPLVFLLDVDALA